MKILIATGIFPPDIGGPATYSKILSEELPKRGIEVKIVAYGASKNSENIIIVSRKWPKGLRHFIYFLKVLRHAADADIIFAQDPVSVGIPALLAAKLLRKKFLLKIVGDYAWEQGFQRFGVNDLLDDFSNKKYGFRVEFLRHLEIFCAKKAEYVIVPSQYLGEVVKKWGVKWGKIKVIYNAVNISKINLSKEQLRKELGLNKDEKIILSVGRWVPWKGFTALAKTFEFLKKEIPNLNLIIIGANAIMKNSKTGGVFDGVDIKLPQVRETVLKYLGVADVFVLNTGYEGLPHQILEAMAVGAPVVTTNVGGNSELIQDGKNGLLVQYNNLEELKTAIKKVLLNKVNVADFVRESHKIANSFTEEKMISGLIKVLNQL